MSKTRMPRRSKSGICAAMAAFVLAAGCSAPRATLIYDALVDGHAVKVASVPGATRLSDLDSLVLDPNAVMAMVRGDYLLLAGLADEHQLLLSFILNQRDYEED